MGARAFGRQWLRGLSSVTGENQLVYGHETHVLQKKVKHLRCSCNIYIIIHKQRFDCVKHRQDRERTILSLCNTDSAYNINLTFDLSNSQHTRSMLFEVLSLVTRPMVPVDQPSRAALFFPLLSWMDDRTNSLFLQCRADGPCIIHLNLIR